MLPKLYHTHHCLHPEDILFWLDLAVRQGDPILELGCGTGRVMHPLALAGYRVFGLDADFQMLTTLRGYFGERPTPRIFQANMGAFHLEASFALVILPCNTLSTLSKETRRATFECVHQHLQPGGLFAASLPNPQGLRRLPRRGLSAIEDIFPHPIDGGPVQASSAWVRTAQQITFFWHYDHLQPDGQIERLTAQACHTLALADEYLVDIRAAGLNIEALLGNFDSQPYTSHAPHLIILARK
jgi:SAM-dependent methyltransferase